MPKLQFKPVEINGVWYEPITEIDTKKGLRSHANQLKKHYADYILRKVEGGWQLVILKEEYDRIDKKYKIFNVKASYRKKRKKYQVDIDQNMIALNRGGRKKTNFAQSI